MGLVNKTTLKSYFETGDTPTEAQFIDAFDSLLSLHADDDQTVAGATTFSDAVVANTTITSPNITTTTAMNIGDGTNTAPIKLKTSSITSVSTSGTTTDLSAFFSAGMIPLSITVKVTTAIGNNGYITKIGKVADDDVFASGIGDGVLEELNDELTCTPVPLAANSFMTGNTSLRLTHNATPDAGAVQVAMVYIDGANIL